MLNFEQREYIKVYFGSPDIRAHIDSVHAHPPNNDKFTGEIAEGIAEQVNCSCIIAIVSRDICDLNRERSKKNAAGIDEYRTAVQQIQKHINNFNSYEKSIKPYLHLAIHGMIDEYGRDFEIGTLYNKTCSVIIKNWFLHRIQTFYKRVTIDTIFPGNSSKIRHREGSHFPDSKYHRFGSNFNTFKIEISRTIREFQRENLISNLSNIIKDFNSIF